MAQRPTALQAAFMAFYGEEAFYGGAGGPGKSSALLLTALQFVDVPGYAALILRRTFRALKQPGALMSRCRQWLVRHPDVHWDGTLYQWRFPSGASITFGHLEDESAFDTYDSAEFQTICIDEATQLQAGWWARLMARLRRPITGALSKVPVRIRGAGNPGGPSHQELKDKFVDRPSTPDSLYLPGTLDDNPHIDRAQYEKTLMHLPPVIRARIMRGDWNVKDTGLLFQREWMAGKRVGAIPKGCRRFIRYWDLAATEVKKVRGRARNDPDWTAGVLMTADPEGNIYVLDVVRIQKGPAEVAAFILATAERDVSVWGTTGYEVWWEEEGGSGGKWASETLHKLLRRYRRRADRKGSKASKVARAGPLSSHMQAGNVYAYEGGEGRGLWIEGWLGELEMFPSPSEADHDDRVDGTSGGYYALFGDGRREHRSPVVFLDTATELVELPSGLVVPGRLAPKAPNAEDEAAGYKPPPAPDRVEPVAGAGRPVIWAPPRR